MSTGESDPARTDQTDSAGENDPQYAPESGPKPCLSFIDKQRLESLFGMSGGYVLDFSNRTLAEFVLDVTGRDIYDQKYDYESGSKANRIRAFWTHESPQFVGKLISGLLDYYRHVNPTGGDIQLIAECERIACRLLGDPASADGVVESERQPIDAKFQFEAGAVTLKSGEVFSPAQHAADRWEVEIPCAYEAAGCRVELLYRTTDDQFIGVTAHVGPRDFYSEDIEKAGLVSHDDARTWLQQNNLMLPDCLMKGMKTFPAVPRKKPKASEPADEPRQGGYPPAVNIGNWHEGGKAFAEAFTAAYGDGNAEADAPEPKPETPADDEDDEQQAPALTKGERMTLTALATFDPSRLASALDVSEAMPAAERLSERTTREAIKKLVKLDLAERPEGEKQGARLKVKGRRLATKLAD